MSKQRFRTRATTVPGVLRAVARRIRTVGWRQGGGIDDDGQMCLVWTVTNATRHLGRHPLDFHVSEVHHEVLDILWMRIQEHVGGDGSIIYWNDAPGRTVEQVLALVEGRPIPEVT